MQSGVGRRHTTDLISLPNVGDNVIANHAYFDDDAEYGRSKSNVSRNFSSGLGTEKQNSSIISPVRVSRNNSTIIVTDDNEKKPISIDLETNQRKTDNLSSKINIKRKAV